MWGAVAVVAVLAGGWLRPSAHAAISEPARRDSYVVREGDTLWSIARRLASGTDPRRVVDELVRANGVDPGSLVPGQTLVVPGTG